MGEETTGLVYSMPTITVKTYAMNGLEDNHHFQHEQVGPVTDLIDLGST